MHNRTTFISFITTGFLLVFIGAGVNAFLSQRMRTVIARVDPDLQLKHRRNSP